MKNIKITIKGLNFFFTVYLYKKIAILRYQLQVMTNTADHYHQIMTDLNNTNNLLRDEIGRLVDYNLNSRKRRRNALMRKKRRYVSIN